MPISAGVSPGALRKRRIRYNGQRGGFIIFSCVRVMQAVVQWACWTPMARQECEGLKHAGEGELEAMKG